MGRPGACDTNAVASCPIGEKYCDMIVGLALTAKTTDKKVEFTYSGQCNSNSFADVSRFRLME